MLSKESDRSQGDVYMLGTPCAKAQSREQASLLLEEEGKQGEPILGGPLEVPVKALMFPWSRIDGNLERIKQEADIM